MIKKIKSRKKIKAEKTSIDEWLVGNSQDPKIILVWGKLKMI